MYKWHYSAPTEHVEADAFFCFTNLMSEIRDNFIKSLDDSACGIGKLHKLLSTGCVLPQILHHNVLKY